MEKAKNIVLVVCGIMLFFGSQAAYGTWLYLFAWAAGVGMLIFGIYGLAKNRKHENANKYTEHKAQENPTVKSKPVVQSRRTNDFFYREYKVVGVTFDTDGVSRQELLEKIDCHAPPFSGELRYGLVPYDFEGEQAIGVHVNDIQIGNISRDDIPEILRMWRRIEDISEVEIVGGEYGFDGHALKYGARVKIKIRREDASA